MITNLQLITNLPEKRTKFAGPIKLFLFRFVNLFSQISKFKTPKNSKELAMRGSQVLDASPAKQEKFVNNDKMFKLLLFIGLGLMLSPNLLIFVWCCIAGLLTYLFVRMLER